MTEATAKGTFVKKLSEVMPQALVWRHEDIFAAGRPDIQVIANRRASFYEVKMERVRITAMQLLTMKRLEREAYAAYFVIVRPQGMYIVSPSDLAESRFTSWDHVVEFVRGIHYGDHRF